MSDSLALLDQALELGRQELERLGSGEVEDLDQLAKERARLINQAWSQRDKALDKELKSKLLQLQGLQGELNAEAWKLHADLRDKLKDNKQQTTRFHGYAQAAKPRAASSRFLSAKG